MAKLSHDDVELVCCCKLNLKRNKQVEILDMHFVVLQQLQQF